MKRKVNSSIFSFKSKERLPLTIIIPSTESIEERYNGTWSNDSSQLYLFKDVPLSSLYLVQTAEVQVDFIPQASVGNPLVAACLKKVTNEKHQTEKYEHACLSKDDSLYLVQKLRQLPHQISGILQLCFSILPQAHHSINKVQLVMKHPGNRYLFQFTCSWRKSIVHSL